MVKIISIANDEDENQWKWWKWDVNWKKERSVCCVARQAACMMGSLRRGDGTPAPSMWFIALTSLLSSLCPRQPLASIGWKPLTFVCRLEMRPKYPIGPVFLQQQKIALIWLNCCLAYVWKTHFVTKFAQNGHYSNQQWPDQSTL